MGHRIGVRHRALLFLTFLLSLFAFGFAPPKDPRVTAVVVPDLGGESIEAAAHRRLACSDCVVLLVAVADHRMRIETGSDARAWLSDDAARKILDDRMRPLLREDRVDDALSAGIVEIERLAPHRDPDKTFVWAICGVAFLFVLLVAVVAFSGAHARRGSASDVHVVMIDSGSGGFSGGGGASSSW